MPAFRAMFLEAGVDPRAADTMSLYELASMGDRLRKKAGKGNVMSDGDYDDMIDQLRGLPGVRV